MVALIQVLGIIVGIYLIIESYLEIKREGDVKLFFGWFFIGIVMCAVSIKLDLLNFILRYLGMEKRTALLFTIGILVSYIFSFKIYKKVEKLRTDISKLNEKVSIMSGLDDDSESD